MKKILALLLALLMILSMVGCAKDNAHTDDAEDKPADAPADDGREASGEKFKIGFAVYDASNEFNVSVIEGVEAAAEEYSDKVEVTINEGKNDVSLLGDILDQFIAQEMDGIILYPNEANAYIGYIERCNEAGIYVVCVNETSNGGEFTYIGSDNYKAGEMQAEWLADKAPDGSKFVHPMCVMGMACQIDRMEGLNDKLAEIRPDIEMLAYQTGNGQRDQGLALTEDWLQAFDFNMVISQNDSMALGAIEAIRSSGDNIDDYIICGIDGTADGLLAVANGEMDMTIIQDGYSQGYTALEVMYQTLIGEYEVGNNVDIPWVLVDETNIDEYVD